MRALATLTSLLLSTALLLVGHGMQLTLLPLRATGLGFSDFLVGLSASAYFAGFVVGCYANPRIIARVGHIRSFSVLAALLLSAVLVVSISSHWLFWVLARFVIGLMICGLYTVIESWLNDQASSDNRGQVLSVYTFLVLVSMAGGQLLLNLASIETAIPFVLAGLFIALAIVPVGLTRSLAPAPIAATRPRFRLLYRRSRVAFSGAVLSGLVVGSFWSLGAVFANRTGSSLAGVTVFITTAIIGGALLQYPIGWMSDRVDRGHVIVGLCAVGAAACVAVALSTGHAWHLAAVFGFGAMTMPLYGLALAVAADYSSSDEFVMIGTSVLLLNALGAAIAPLGLGPVMDYFGPQSLFWAFAVMLALGGLYIVLQNYWAEAPREDQQVPFAAAATEMAPTSFDLDPRSPEDSVGELEPVEEAPSLHEMEHPEEAAPEPGEVTPQSEATEPQPGEPAPPPEESAPQSKATVPESEEALPQPEGTTPQPEKADRQPEESAAQPGAETKT